MNTETDPTRLREKSLVIVGHIARDIIRHPQRGTHERLGGAASFAALAAATLGYESTVVTAAPPNSALLKPLREMSGISLRIKACPEPTTFELDYGSPTRRLRLLHRAPKLSPQDIPIAARDAPVAYVCPVIGECGLATMRVLRSDCVVIGVQGWLRCAADDGQVLPAVLPDAKTFSHVRAVSFSELDHPESEALARYFAGRSDIVALTRGARGVTLFRGNDTIDLPAVAADEVDPTGAGDVFAVVFGLALHAGKPWVDAAKIATRVAARIVEGPGLGRLSEVTEKPLT